MSPHPPFGVKVGRFANIGYHPNLEFRSGTYKLPKLHPGCYDWDDKRHVISKVPRWKRQQEIEEYCRRLGYKNDHVLNWRKWLKSINGPGWQDVPPPSLNKGCSFPKAKRGPTSKRKAHADPGPGTYGKYHVPFTRKEEKSHSKGFSFSVVPPFEQTSMAPRSFATQKSYHLPPNLYKIKSFADEITSKRISKRGPYDLFTGERFPDPFVFKYSPLKERLEPSDLSHPSNAFKGKFLICGKDSQITTRQALKDAALAKKNPSDPAPNQYDPYPTPRVTQALGPFNVYEEEVRPVVRCGISPSPGRYSQDYKRSIFGGGWKSAFISKVKRNLPQPEKTSWFE